MEIEDGTGHGFSAKVDDNNRLHVRSTILESEAAAAANGDAFILHAQCHVAAAATGAFMYFKNTSSTHNVILTRMFFDAQTLSDDLIITQQFDPTPTSGSSATAVNKNRGSGNSLTGTFTISDGSADLTLASGTDYHAFILQTLQREQRFMRSTNILTPNTAWGIGWATLDAGAGVNAEIVGLSINLYREPI